MSFQKALCLICERPTADGAVLAVHVDKEKLQTWFLNVCEYEMDQEIYDDDLICYFCTWDAEFLWKFDRMADEALVWWPARNSDHLDDAAKELRKNYFEGKLEQCWVQLEKIELPNTLILFLAICIEQVEMAKSRGNRKFIIKCCGRKSCSKLPLKKANRTIITQPTKPNLTSSSTFSTGGSDEIVEKNSGDPKTAETELQKETKNIQQESAAIKPDETESTETTGTTVMGPSAATWTNFVSTDTLVTNSNFENRATSVETTTILPSTTARPAKESTIKPNDTKPPGTTKTTMKSSTATVTNSVSTKMAVTKSDTSDTVTTGSTIIATSLKIYKNWTTSSDSMRNAITTIPSSTTPRPLKRLYRCSDLSCVKNKSLFDTSETLKDARKYGSWREICGELYLFGKSIVTWEENAKRCCAIGMKPLAFETSAKFSCLQKFIKAEVWQYNYNYWTAARQIFANNSFNWCSYEANGSFANLTSMWAANYTGKGDGDSCVHMFVPRSKNMTEMTMKNCSNLYMFSCKGTTTPAPRCFAPACPQDKCRKNDTLFSPGVDNVTKFLSNPAQYGLWKSMNFRIFMFSREFKTWDDARRTCCSIGMKLLSLDVAYKYSVLSQISGDDSPTLNAKFWTSGTENGCPGAFGWCAENKLVRNAMWARNEPRNGSHCLAAAVSSTNTTLMTADCGLALRFICETRDTSNSTSKGEAMKDECATNFNVSIDEQDNIFNSSSFSAKIKCFLKCLGESGGIVLDGRVVDEQLIKLAEILSFNDDAKLMENLEAVDECSKFKGMDECDTIANVFQCGQEKAPNLVANVINSIEMNSTGVEKSPLQPALGECVDHICIVDMRLELF
ncbi:Hypothetical predicted protein [Cloeon dipterum]|uniref:C-type lectin domain-containing protein n=1 Tax=Cloeon dipterum TaxID=197152 RepID=A0A8S1E1J0_9INSE|nr:Hypothetical predicted protein [Cloeon dipterum]